jgi:MFS family permease
MMARMLFRLSIALFGLQAGFHGFTASLPLVLARSGVPDSEIGLIVGVAAVVQVPAAFAGGALVDRFGGVRLLGVGALAYLLGAAVLLLPGVDPAADRLPFVVARISQGIGIALTLPAALSLVPRLVPDERRGFGLAFVGSAHTLTLVALPPISLAVLGDDRSLATVTIVVVAFVATGALLLFASPLRRAAAPLAVSAAAPRLRFAFRRTWIAPLVVTLLYVAHWGVVTAYLPQRAEFAGADVGLFFAADGVAVLAFRIPSGWLTDRIQSRWLVLTGLFLTGIAIGLLVLPPTTPILVVAGLLTGSGAGLVMTPLLVEMSRRSSDADRGSAFAMVSAALAAALVLGSIGAAPIIGSAGFEATILASIAGLVLATIVALADPLLGSRAGGGRPTAEIGAAPG